MQRTLLYACVIIIAFTAAWFIFQTFISESQENPEQLVELNIDKRPEGERFLYDYAKILSHFEEGISGYLKRIANDFYIEAVILTLPNLPPGESINRVSSELINQWKIGGRFEGRAVLLLLVQDIQEVRLEVGYELEDVFTDSFVGYVEDIQLKSNFLNDDIGTGLIALMEELERRAELKYQGDYTSELIAHLDTKFISGGAGAKRDLTKYTRSDKLQNDLSNSLTRGAHTPEEAWQTMLMKWTGLGSNINIEVYTELTKMAMGDPNHPDPRTKKSLPHWQNAEFRVLKENDHAVIYLGYKKGWDNAPFLFCRDKQGWKFDIVHQRRLVVMGSQQSWFVEQGPFPYVSLLQEVPQSTGKDLPLDIDDLYRCNDDAAIAKRIKSLTAKIERSPNDYPLVRELLQLNVITGRRPNHVQPLIQRAKVLAPDDPLPHKYAAIYNVNTFFQYKSALKEIEAYLQLGGEPTFGYNFKGFLHYRLKQYQKAVAALEKVIVSAPENVYALSLLSRVYTLRYLSLNKIDPRRANFRAKALEYLQQAQSAPSKDLNRVTRLTAWIQSKNI